MTNRPGRINRWLIRIFAVLLVALAVQYLFIFISAPAFYRLAVNGQVPTHMMGADVTLSQAMLAENAAHRGLSLPAYILYFLVLNAVVAIGFWTAGMIVVLRAGRQWFPWFTAVMLVFYPSGNLWQICSAVYPTPAAYLDILSLLWPCFPLFIFLFPDGRAVPRWARWPMAVYFLSHLAIQALGFVASLPGSPLKVPGSVTIAFAVILTVFPFVFVCQVYRYLRDADAVARKQIQWIVAVLALFAVATIINIVTGGATSTADQGYWSDFDIVTDLMLPVAIAIAILRYRLWNIDVIIRRTLIYSVLTGLLALAYLGSVLLLQNVFQALTGRSQDQLVAVVSTLGIAALFVPLRARVQSVIDHRFFRRKYDAAKTVAAFGGAMRDEVELKQLTERLLDTVETSVQPAHASLWLSSGISDGHR